MADRVLEMGKVNAFWSKVSEFQLFETYLLIGLIRASSIEREKNSSSPFQANSTMVQKPRHPPWRDVVPVSPFSFRHWRGVSSRRGVEKREKEKRERKEERRNLSLPAASSPLPTLCLVPRIITHPRSSPILER